MMINNDTSGVSLTLCKDDLQQLKHFLDNHLMIPKAGVDPTTTWDVFGKLLRALDLILEPQKEPNKNE